MAEKDTFVCGFRRGRAYDDQLFAVREICEKYIAKRKDMFLAFIYLAKAHASIDIETVWTMLRICG